MLWDASESRGGGFEEQPLQGMNGQYDDEESAVPVEGGHRIGQGAPDADPSMRMRSWFAVAFASVVWASSTYIVRLLTHPTPHLGDSVFERTASP